jgi:uncharacterized sulfatase
MTTLRSILGIGIVGCLAGPTSAEEQRPNVVMILADDIAWNDYGFMKHPNIRTPHIDRLAAQAALFPNGYVPTSLCRASLATLLTGLYAHQHNICCNDPPKGIDRERMLPFLSNAPTVPRLLGTVGYRSLQTGKFWEGHHSNGGFTHGMTTKGRHGDDGLAIGRQTMKPIQDFLDEVGEKPFFLWYAPMMPHTPHNPPEQFLKPYLAPDRDERLAKYWAMCTWFDETVGSLLGDLDRRGLTKNTLVIYCADNGWIQATGPVQPREQFLTRSKNTPYDAGVRTPIIFSWPGRIPAGRHDDLVSTIDLAPTILSACGVNAPADWPGVDLLPRLAGQELPRKQVFGEIFEHDCKELGKPALSLTHRWVREGDWKLILPTATGQGPELYQLAEDPEEKRNCAEQMPERVAALRAALDHWWAGR